MGYNDRLRAVCDCIYPASFPLTHGRSALGKLREDSLLVSEEIEEPTPALRATLPLEGISDHGNC